MAWAFDAGVNCADEVLLSPAPHATRSDWCAARVAYTASRLGATPAGTRLVLVNHWPLRPDLAVLPRIPRFTIWCGTTKTADWHTRYPVDVVVSGHLHMRSTRWRDGVRFEEVCSAIRHSGSRTGAPAATCSRSCRLGAGRRRLGR